VQLNAAVTANLHQQSIFAGPGPVPMVWLAALLSCSQCA
jgi:hypothetical protein